MDVDIQGLHDKLIGRVTSNSQEIMVVKGMVADQSRQLTDQGKKIDQILEALSGNGSGRSIYSRLIVVEERQVTAAQERREMAKKVAHLTECVDRRETEAAVDREKIAKIDSIDDTVKGWKNRIVGISIGIGTATSIILFLIFVILERIIGGTP